MTPEELALVTESADIVCADADSFADSFYSTLFEIAPESRALFPTAMTDQKGKLVDELVFLVDAAQDLDNFVQRARSLGARHAGYGVRFNDYDAVGAALISAVAEQVGEDWTMEHQRACQKLYRLIADVMREGASSQLFA